MAVTEHQCTGHAVSAPSDPLLNGVSVVGEKASMNDGCDSMAGKDLPDVPSSRNLFRGGAVAQLFQDQLYGTFVVRGANQYTKFDGLVARVEVAGGL